MTCDLQLLEFIAFRQPVKYRMVRSEVLLILHAEEREVPSAACRFEATLFLQPHNEHLRPIKRHKHLKYMQASCTLVAPSLVRGTSWFRQGENICIFPLV